MQFQVPQFIEVEDKIIGPLTFRQFVFVAGGLGMSFVLWKVLPFFIAVPLILAVGGLATALAFFQYNGRPFIVALENGFYYVLHPKLYLWNNERKKKTAAQPVAAAERSEVYIPKLSDSRLHELAWSLDIKERIAAGTVDAQERESLDSGGIVAPVRTARDIMTQLKSREITQ